MSYNSFSRVVGWLRKERQHYQMNKFDYETEGKQNIDYWEQQFDSYIQRLRVFPRDSLAYKQAALKLAATAVAHAEHACDDMIFPLPGVSSGELKEWV